MTTLDARLSRLESAVTTLPDIDAEIERLLGRMTPDEQAAFIAECAREFGLELEQHDA